MQCSGGRGTRCSGPRGLHPEQLHNSSRIIAPEHPELIKAIQVHADSKVPNQRITDNPLLGSPPANQSKKHRLLSIHTYRHVSRSPIIVDTRPVAPSRPPPPSLSLPDHHDATELLTHLRLSRHRAKGPDHRDSTVNVRLDLEGAREIAPVFPECLRAAKLLNGRDRSTRDRSVGPQQSSQDLLAGHPRIKLASMGSRRESHHSTQLKSQAYGASKRRSIR
ncbi:hypothetical protein BGZ61DRAFT_477083 [Ilyonectria robusta]|uniref:uncharacterized protein n=1 Tax=Ilyonectria robusta TaxID=1079257 RepID=UPI001E8D27A4|nr:uncharacterized protein BGZ61DRAFT_477083 [Ilyonectria robusta]KAH8706435.1 hypothetical protein BGZ61DRAFT_477083 [Ilyonectria robusta]